MDSFWGPTGFQTSLTPGRPGFGIAPTTDATTEGSAAYEPPFQIPVIQLDTAERPLHPTTSSPAGRPSLLHTLGDPPTTLFGFSKGVNTLADGSASSAVWFRLPEDRRPLDAFIGPSDDNNSSSTGANKAVLHAAVGLLERSPAAASRSRPTAGSQATATESSTGSGLLSRASTPAPLSIGPIATASSNGGFLSGRPLTASGRSSPTSAPACFSLTARLPAHVSHGSPVSLGMGRAGPVGGSSSLPRTPATLASPSEGVRAVFASISGQSANSAGGTAGAPHTALNTAVSSGSPGADRSSLAGTAGAQMHMSGHRSSARLTEDTACFGAVLQTVGTSAAGSAGGHGPPRMRQHAGLFDIDSSIAQQLQHHRAGSPFEAASQASTQGDLNQSVVISRQSSYNDRSDAEEDDDDEEDDALHFVVAAPAASRQSSQQTEAPVASARNSNSIGEVQAEKAGRQRPGKRRGVAEATGKSKAGKKKPKESAAVSGAKSSGSTPAGANRGKPGSTRARAASSAANATLATVDNSSSGAIAAATAVGDVRNPQYPGALGGAYSAGLSQADRLPLPVVQQLQQFRPPFPGMRAGAVGNLDQLHLAAGGSGALKPGISARPWLVHPGFPTGPAAVRPPLLQAEPPALPLTARPPFVQPVPLRPPHVPPSAAPLPPMGATTAAAPPVHAALLNAGSTSGLATRNPAAPGLLAPLPIRFQPGFDRVGDALSAATRPPLPFQVPTASRDGRSPALRLPIQRPAAAALTQVATGDGLRTATTTGLPAQPADKSSASETSPKPPAVAPFVAAEPILESAAAGPETDEGGLEFLPDEEGDEEDQLFAQAAQQRWERSSSTPSAGTATPTPVSLVIDPLPELCKSSPMSRGSATVTPLPSVRGSDEPSLYEPYGYSWAPTATQSSDAQRIPQATSSNSSTGSQAAHAGGAEPHRITIYSHSQPSPSHARTARLGEPVAYPVFNESRYWPATLVTAPSGATLVTTHSGAVHGIGPTRPMELAGVKRRRSPTELMDPHCARDSADAGAEEYKADLHRAGFQDEEGSLKLAGSGAAPGYLHAATAVLGGPPQGKPSSMRGGPPRPGIRDPSAVLVQHLRSLDAVAAAGGAESDGEQWLLPEGWSRSQHYAGVYHLLGGHQGCNWCAVAPDRSSSIGLFLTEEAAAVAYDSFIWTNKLSPRYATNFETPITVQQAIERRQGTPAPTVYRGLYQRAAAPKTSVIVKIPGDDNAHYAEMTRLRCDTRFISLLTDFPWLASLRAASKSKSATARAAAPQAGAGATAPDTTGTDFHRAAAAAAVAAATRAGLAGADPAGALTYPAAERPQHPGMAARSSSSSSTATAAATSPVDSTQGAPTPWLPLALPLPRTVPPPPVPAVAYQDCLTNPSAAPKCFTDKTVDPIAMAAAHAVAAGLRGTL